MMMESLVWQLRRLKEVHGGHNFYSVQKQRLPLMGQQVIQRLGMWKNHYIMPINQLMSYLLIRKFVILQSLDMMRLKNTLIKMQ